MSCMTSQSYLNFSLSSEVQKLQRKSTAWCPRPYDFKAIVISCLSKLIYSTIAITKSSCYNLNASAESFFMNLGLLMEIFSLYQACRLLMSDDHNQNPGPCRDQN